MKAKRTQFDFAEGHYAPAPTLPPPLFEEELTLAMPALPTKEADMHLAPIPHQAPAPSRVAPSTGAGIHWLAALGSALWAGGMIGLLLAYQQRMGFFDFDAFSTTVFALLAAAPLGLIWLCVYAVRQGSAFVTQARRSQDYAEQMLQPAAYAAAEAGSVVESIRTQIDRAVGAAAQARDELTELRELLAHETARLIDTAAASAQTARSLVEGLRTERQELTTLSSLLDHQAESIGEAIARQGRMVAEASDLAQTQIAEAEAALAARAADLATAASEAGSAVRVAGEDIARQTARLEAAGTSITEQVQVAEDILSQQRAGLVATAHGLRADQEELSVQMETQRAQLADIIAESGTNITALHRAVGEGAGALRQLTTEAADQFREVAESAHAERDMLGAAAVQSLGAFSEAAGFERRALEEQTRRAIEALQTAAELAHSHAETSGEAARIKIEQLSEAAFAAGQKADTVFDARLQEARDLIERTALLVDEAGQRSVIRLDTSVANAREALAALEQGMAAIESRSARMPQDAQDRAEEIRASLEQATQSLLATARQAATETQAIDAAFQDRVKRNYEMLSEAVRLMGVMGGGAAARASGAGSRPAPPTPPAPRPAPEPFPLRQSAPAPAPLPAPEPAPVQAAAASPALAPPAEPARSRLKLTATTAEDIDTGMFEPIAAPGGGDKPAFGDEWTWTDLLGAVDSGGPDEPPLADVLIGEIETIGLDPVSLLPRSRIDEFVGLLDAGDAVAGRESVRRLAPAAIRRLSRRVLSDKVLRSQSDRFIQSYQSLLREAGRPGAELSRHTLLSAPAGRAYLLLDAAVGDLS